jgi:hypothetical protein
VEITVINTTKDVLTLLTSTITDRFTEQGFSLRKDRYFEKTNDSGRTHRYAIKVSKNKGWFSLHLTLHLLDTALMKDVNKVLEKALRDETLKYPDSFSATMIEDIVKTRTSNMIVAELTDWRALKDADETLEAFNARFSIWLFSFDQLKEKPDWKEQLSQSVTLALEWFRMVDSQSWIESNTTYPSLYLLSKQSAPEALNTRYEHLLKKATNRQELALFYRHLS